MKKITIYDPAMCCTTGVCGPEVDPLLTRFAGMLSKLGSSGVVVERYNLAQQPMAFAQNAAVRAELEERGVEALPLIYVDGQLELRGRYPETEERTALVKRARAAETGETTGKS
jgi:hypothetical protein